MEELLAEQQQEESWSPNPQDWFAATFDYRLSKDILVGKFENQDRVWIPVRDVRSPGQHVCFEKGTAMLVRIEFNLPTSRHRVTKHNRFQYRALEAVIEGDFLTTKETGVLESWSGAYGVARRPCGCALFCKTSGPTLDLKEGSPISFETQWSDFKARHIGIVQEA
jgi:hypothetical protein